MDLCTVVSLQSPLSSSHVIPKIVAYSSLLQIGAIDLAYSQLKMLGSPERVPPLIEAVKAKKQRLFGYGHRIYKKADPRTKFLRDMIGESVAAAADTRSPGAEEDARLLEVALAIDNAASTDAYFTSRKLVANADLLGALLYTSLGFERDLILPLSGQARMAGIMAHWRETMTQSPALWRPLQNFTGVDARAVQAQRHEDAVKPPLTLQTSVIGLSEAAV